MSNLSRLKTSLVIITGLVIFSITPLALAAGYGAGVLEFQMKLASNGSANAQYRLATMFESGQGTAQDHNKAMGWYKKAAEQNHKAAINRLTYIDIRDNGFKASHKPWLSSLEKAAASRDGESMLLLGQMYGDGVAINQNYHKAIELLKLAKAKGVIGSEDELFKIENK
ncbi:MAG: sel1 repeat family protein, partial [Gammaproteobacteria bacterium]|nr:sel1 repeat family protein [Gammaproteobacteria bacterium]